MRTVYKYPVPIDDYFRLDLPKGAKPLHLAEQYGNLQLWVLVDPTAPLQERWFRFAGTGHPIKESAEQLQHISTVVLENETLIFHLFEVVS